MADLVVMGILVIAVGAAVYSLVRAKRNGVRCIGCSSLGHCAGKGGGGCGCGCHSGKEE